MLTHLSKSFQHQVQKRTQFWERKCVRTKSGQYLVSIKQGTAYLHVQWWPSDQEELLIHPVTQGSLVPIRASSVNAHEVVVSMEQVTQRGKNRPEMTIHGT